VSFLFKLKKGDNFFAFRVHFLFFKFQFEAQGRFTPSRAQCGIKRPKNARYRHILPLPSQKCYENKGVMHEEPAGACPLNRNLKQHYGTFFAVQK